MRLVVPRDMAFLARTGHGAWREGAVAARRAFLARVALFAALTFEKPPLNVPFLTCLLPDSPTPVTCHSAVGGE